MIATHSKHPERTKLLERPTFRELYLAAFTGLHSQFEQYAENDDLGGLTVYYEGGKESVERSKFFAKIAYNSAMEACELFEEQETIRTFNKKAR